MSENISKKSKEIFDKASGKSRFHCKKCKGYGYFGPGFGKLVDEGMICNCYGELVKG